MEREIPQRDLECNGKKIFSFINYNNFKEGLEATKEAYECGAELYPYATAAVFDAISHQGTQTTLLKWVLDHGGIATEEALVSASIQGNINSVKLLIEYGANYYLGRDYCQLEILRCINGESKKGKAGIIECLKNIHICSEEVNFTSMGQDASVHDNDIM